MVDIDPWRNDYPSAPSYREDMLSEFAEWIVSLDDDNPNSPGRIDRQTVTLTKIIERARHALED